MKNLARIAGISALFAVGMLAGCKCNDCAGHDHGNAAAACAKGDQCCKVTGKACTDAACAGKCAEGACADKAKAAGCCGSCGGACKGK